MSSMIQLRDALPGLQQVKLRFVIAGASNYIPPRDHFNYLAFPGRGYWNTEPWKLVRLFQGTRTELAVEGATRIPEISQGDLHRWFHELQVAASRNAY